MQLVTRIFKDDVELETYITSAHYAVCSDVRYVVFFVRADKKGNFIPGTLSPLGVFFVYICLANVLMFGHWIG